MSNLPHTRWAFNPSRDPIAAKAARQNQIHAYLAAPAKPGSAPGPAQRLSDGPTISAEAKRLDDLDNGQFEMQAADFLCSTLTRPALIAHDEVEAIRTGYATGAGRLDVLAKVTGKRLDFYTETRGGGAPFDPLTDKERAKVVAFFEKHGARLADEPKLAPPNPLRSKDDGKLIEQAKVALAAPARAATNLAADKAIVEAERPKPTPQPAAAAEPKPVGPPGMTRIEIEFTNSDGFAGRLVVFPGTSAQQVAQLVQMAGMVSANLVTAGYTAAKAAAAPGPVGLAAGETPKCKYHGPMKPSKKPGGFFCPKKLADGSYCDQKYEGAV